MKKLILILLFTLGIVNLDATSYEERTKISIETLRTLKSGLEADIKVVEGRLNNSLLALDNCKKADVSDHAMHSVELQGAYFCGATMGMQSSVRLLDYMIDVLEGKVELE